MTGERKAEDVLRDWSRLAVHAEPRAAVERRRDRMVSQIARQIALTAEQRHRARRGRAVLATLAVAAAVAVGVGLSRKTTPEARSPATSLEPRGVAELRGTRGVSVHRGGATLGVTEGLKLAAGDEVQTIAQARNDLWIEGGAVVTLDGASRVRVRSSEMLEITTGKIDVSVPKLEIARSFAVRTPDARIVVHGTRFIVSVADITAKPRTRVQVLKGRVSVQYEGKEAFVVANESWPLP